MLDGLGQYRAAPATGRTSVPGIVVSEFLPPDGVIADPGGTPVGGWTCRSRHAAVVESKPNGRRTHAAMLSDPVTDEEFAAVGSGTYGPDRSADVQVRRRCARPRQRVAGRVPDRRGSRRRVPTDGGPDRSRSRGPAGRALPRPDRRGARLEEPARVGYRDPHRRSRCRDGCAAADSTLTPVPGGRQSSPCPG